MTSYFSSHTYLHTYIQTDRQTDIQTDRHTYIGTDTDTDTDAYAFSFLYIHFMLLVEVGSLAWFELHRCLSFNWPLWGHAWLLQLFSIPSRGLSVGPIDVGTEPTVWMRRH